MKEYRWLLLVICLCIASLFVQFFCNTSQEIIMQNDVVYGPGVLPKDDDAYEFLYGREYENALEKAEKATKKIILAWYSLDPEVDLPRECGGCLVRNADKWISDIRTEAVIIHHDRANLRDIPRVKRNPHQYWIWRCAEAPTYMSRGNWLQQADQIGFNASLTYRRDSDFQLSYGNATVETGTELEKPLANKKHLALIAISNCDLTPGAVVRLAYVKKLLTMGLKLEAFGQCFGKTPVSRSDYMKNEMIEYTSQYKFYFAFENSYHCKDYVTEKFFRALIAGVVPVVWGSTKEVYEAHIPATGFIFVEDFPSMQHLIDHLNYLDRNDTAYLQYFRWRTERRHHPHYKRRYHHCQICRFLHGIRLDDAYKVPYRDLNKTDFPITGPPKRPMSVSVRKLWAETDNFDCLQKNLRLDTNGRIVAE